MNTLIENKDKLSADEYSRVLSDEISNLIESSKYNPEKDRALVEKLGRELVSNSGPKSKESSCSVWHALESLNSGSDPDTSPQVRHLRVTLLKSLFQLQKNKITCNGMPDVQSLVQEMQEANVLNPEDLQELSKQNTIASSQPTRAKAASDGSQCGFNEIRSELRNNLDDFQASGSKKAKELYTMTSPTVHVAN